MDTGGGNRRKRGVRASRTRLYRALNQAGLKTQSALAEHIADLEGLVAPPRDMVNRVFRERPVEFRSLERVANALGVPAYSLYMTASDADLPIREVPESDRPPVDNGNGVAREARLARPWAWITATVIGLLLLADILTRLPYEMPLRCAAQELLHPLTPAKGKLGVIVTRFDKDPANRGQHFLAMHLTDDNRLAPYVSVVKTCRVLSLDAVGDTALRRKVLIEQAHEMLRRSGALVLLWGRVDDDRMEVHFVSTQPDKTPVRLTFGHRNVSTRESRLKIPVSSRHPSDAMSNVKQAVIELMDPATQAQAKLRGRAMRAYGLQ